MKIRLIIGIMNMEWSSQPIARMMGFSCSFPKMERANGFQIEKSGWRISADICLDDFVWTEEQNSEVLRLFSHTG